MGRRIAAIVLVLLIAGLWYLPYGLEPLFNRVDPHPPHEVSATAAKLHNQSIIMDWHADSLLWKRDINRQVSHGHVDVARLQQGNVGLQMFTVVTKSPSGQNYQQNDADSDRITSLVVAQRWPISTWGSLYSRAAYQADKLALAISESDQRLMWVRNQQELSNWLAKRERGEKVVGALLGMEGAHPLEGDLSNLQRFYDMGYRMIGLQHFFDNQLGGSLHGLSQQGLTDWGKQAIAEMDRLELIIDVAHSSEAVVRDVLSLTKRPIVVSHTGFKGQCDSARNISDALMQEIAQAGGLIAVGYWPGAVCDHSPRGIAKMIEYGISLVGADAVALGSDFDGSVETQLDTSEIAAITHELLALGVSATDIRKVLGENSVTFLQKVLPSR